MKEISIYNTLSRKVEKLVPVNEGRVNMYVCGITSYDLCHVGHARAYVTFDVVRRMLAHFGYDVLYIQNFTDIDDKIIVRANERGEAPDKLSGRFVDAYFQDMDALKIMRASFYPRVTRHINEIVETIKKLIESGHAYEGGGSVYFDVSSCKNYGALSGRETKEDELVTRIDDPDKRGALDFALWKNAKPGEPEWDSPWGKGRPGWHVECNVMSSLYLGETFDIHGGGHDLIFPHHENELAIAGVLSDAPFANYWMHNGFVTIDEEKMSKSLGNIISLRGMLENFSSDVIRLFLLSAHYRMPVSFSSERLEETRAGYERFSRLAERLETVASGFQAKRMSGDEIDAKAAASEKAGGPSAELAIALKAAADAFDNALADDFNTPGAVAELYNMLRAGNIFASHAESVTDVEQKSSIPAIASLIWNYIIKYGGVLGLTFESSRSSGTSESDTEKLVEILLGLRADARKNKDFITSDRIRDELSEAGIIIKDRPEGASWSRK